MISQEIDRSTRQRNHHDLLTVPQAQVDHQFSLKAIQSDLTPRAEPPNPTKLVQDQRSNGCGWRPTTGQKSAQRPGNRDFNGAVTDVEPTLQHTMTYSCHDLDTSVACSQDAASACGYFH